jgi:hypothetical protein
MGVTKVMKGRPFGAKYKTGLTIHSKMPKFNFSVQFHSCTIKCNGGTFSIVNPPNYFGYME